MYALAIIVEDDLQYMKMPKKAWHTLMVLFAKTNDAKLQKLKNVVLSITQHNMTINQYFFKVKSICDEISKFYSHNANTEMRIRRVIVQGLKPEYKGFNTATHNWVKSQL